MEVQNFWELIEQAGPLRWPIFAVLVFGSVLLLMKSFELWRDQRTSRKLMTVDFRDKSIDEIERILRGERASMLSSLHASLFNVVSSQGSAHSLHDEVANFVRQQQERFDAFKMRMDFLADSAGALGLMGTVWGMFEVFFQGASDKDVILRGMGIALITTLLGIVVSLILNLGTTEVSSFFSRAVDRLERRAVVLRFRLMELLAGRETETVHVDPGVAPNALGNEPAPLDSSDLVLQFGNVGDEFVVGQHLDLVTAALKDRHGSPVVGVPVQIALANGSGTIEGHTWTVITDEEGRASFSLTIPRRVGCYRLTASIESAPAVRSHADVVVKAAAPEQFVQRGNNQAAPAGSAVPQPVAVMALDAFGNPVSGYPIRFEFVDGGGGFLDGDAAVIQRTDATGVATADTLKLGPVPGPNVVRATANGAETVLEFTLFGTAP